MEKNRIEDLVLLDNKFKDLSKEFIFLLLKVMLNEDELATILGKNFSKSTLESSRKKAVHIIEYVQNEERTRVFYPILSLLEILTGVNLANKNVWYEKRIREITKSYFLNSNQLAKLFDISPSTVKTYRETGKLPKFDSQKKWNVSTISSHILCNTIKSTYNN